MLPREIPKRLCLDLIVARAVYDHHHGTIFNGWEPASDEFMTYQEEIERLNEFKKERNLDDFLQGQRDCRDGRLAIIMSSESYDRGYAAQYEKEQVQAEMTKND